MHARNLWILGRLVAMSAVFCPCAIAGVIIEETTFTVAPGAVGDGAATCPADRRAVSGGVGTIEAFVGSTIEASAPVDGTGTLAGTTDGDVARGWYARIANDFRLIRTYKVFALCSDDSDAVVEVNTLDLAAGEGTSELATCPAGRRALGGGVGAINKDVRSTVFESVPVNSFGAVLGDAGVAQAWRARPMNSSARKETYKVFALCSATSSATSKATLFSVDSGHVSSGVATCPAGRRVVGGGVAESSTSAFVFLRVSGPLDSTGTTIETGDGDTASSWHASVVNESSRTGSFALVALCE